MDYSVINMYQSSPHLPLVSLGMFFIWIKESSIHNYVYDYYILYTYLPAAFNAGGGLKVCFGLIGRWQVWLWLKIWTNDNRLWSCRLVSFVRVNPVKTWGVGFAAAAMEKQQPKTIQQVKCTLCVYWFIYTSPWPPPPQENNCDTVGEE